MVVSLKATHRASHIIILDMELAFFNFITYQEL